MFLRSLFLYGLSVGDRYYQLIPHYPHILLLQSTTSDFTIDLQLSKRKIKSKQLFLMSLSETVRENFNVLRVCVIIPTYNNAATLQKVIEEASIYTDNIIVVNDGSSDDSLTIIKKFAIVHLVTTRRHQIIFVVD